MYLAYLKEREGLEVIETDYGFILYKIVEQQLYIAEIFVQNSCRRAGLSTDLADKARNLAVEKGCNLLSCQADISANGAEEAIIMILKYGFRIHGIDGNLIYFTMGI